MSILSSFNLAFFNILREDAKKNIEKILPNHEQNIGILDS